MKAKRFISTLLVLILIVSTISAVGIVSADAASNPYFTNKKSDSITHNTAHVHAYVKNPGKYALIEAGCIVKTKSGSWSKTFVDKGFNLKGEINLDYYIGVKGTAKGTKLSPNTAYTYQFYVKAKGQSKTFYSGVCNFTTKADPSKPTFSSLSHSNVTYNNAKVSVHVNNPKGVKITEVGVKIYSTNGEFSKTLSEKQNLTKGFDLYYLMSSNKVAKVTLIAQRTYKYQFYIKANGYGTLKSGTGTFTTPKKPVASTTKATEICFPLRRNLVWSASTYPNHGSKFGAAYSSVDIVLKNGKSAEGQGVYAAEAGKVISYDSKNGQIVIQHTQKLVTTNNKTYTKWYTVYAHMKNIKVKVGNTIKRGQQIGQVSKVGKATGPHLHFNIISGNGNTAWNANNKNKAISPYYVYGFVQANGKNTSYCVCDRSGPAVTATLINWKPTGK